MNTEQWLQENLPDIHFQTDGARGGWVGKAKGLPVRLHFETFPTVEAIIEAAKFVKPSLNTPTCKRCGSVLRGGFCSDETCPFSDHVQSCPQGSDADLRCSCHKRIIATFVPQVDIGKRIEDTEETHWRRFDATEAVLAMGKEKALALQDDGYESDDLLPADVLGNHDGPYRVVVQQAIEDYFDREFCMGEQESNAGSQK